MLLAAPAATAADTGAPIVVHRDPGCECCEKWVDRVRASFQRPVRMVDDPQRAQFQRRHGVPAYLASCHTAIIDGIAFEGHVPIADMRRVLAERPADVRGLAVAGMPIGSPGMEMPGRAADPYVVAAFGNKGAAVFARHPR